MSAKTIVVKVPRGPMILTDYDSLESDKRNQPIRNFREKVENVKYAFKSRTFMSNIGSSTNVYGTKPNFVKLAAMQKLSF